MFRKSGSLDILNLTPKQKVKLEKNKNLQETYAHMPDAQKFDDCRRSLFERQKLKPGLRPPIVETLRVYLMKWFPSLKSTEDDLLFMKAKEQLEKQMDI